MQKEWHCKRNNTQRTTTQEKRQHVKNNNVKRTTTHKE
jgi:hypothetical protein